MPEATKETRRLREWYRPMRSRDSGEGHRASTPLELLFDLSFVVAVGQAGASLHHGLGEGHAGAAVLHFMLVFVAIWWGWLNFSWFASAFDTDDVPYRLATFVQIAGGLTVAAGVPRAFDHEDFSVILAGYVLMRLAMVAQWLRAAATDPRQRWTATRYATGVTLMQVLWIAWFFLPHAVLVPGLVLLMLGEMAVPVVAERVTETSWHPHHIAERYGLFTLIVLGETILGATTAVQEGIAGGEHIGELIGLAAAGLVLVCSLWWLYFDRPGHARIARSRAFRTTISWGYGHFLIFSSAAAVGAGLEAAVDRYTHAGGLPALTAGMVVTVPVAVYLLSVWLLHIGPTNECRPIAIGFPATAVLVLAASFTPAPVHVTAVLAAALVALTVAATRGHPLDA